MTKRNTLIVAVVVALASFNLVQQIPAGSDTQNGYTLTVSKAAPAYTPNPAPVWNANNQNAIITKFELSVEKETATGKEDASGDVSYCDYLATASGNETFIVSWLPLWVTGMVTSITKKDMPFYSEIKPALRALTPGDKSVSLSVKVVMKDGTTLNASDAIEFKVHAYGITLYAIPGITGTSYVYDVTGITWEVLGLTIIGHATWEIYAYDTSSLSSTKWNNYVNIPCGFSVNSVIQFLVNLVAYPGSGLPVVAPGLLKKNDTSGGNSKFFNATIIQVENGLDKTKDIDTSTPDYDLHSNNCTDVCLSVAGATGVTFPSSCRRPVTLWNGVTGNTRTSNITLSSELAKYLN
jgi:hypothetical protein